jgi:predicted metal-dependent hydrolase
MSALPYRIRRSARARHARIVVSPAGVEVVVPSRFPLSRVEPFVAEKRPWIDRTLRRYSRTEAEHPPARLEHGGELPLLGERLALRVRREPGRVRAHVAQRGGELRVALGPRHRLEEEVEAWYRRRARAEVAPRLAAACARAGVAAGPLQIRGQRTRWASCSSSGAMSFNWRLLLAPPEILDYVIEHEVAHLTVHDHSERFWRLLAKRCPQMRARERWLRDFGHTLRLD